MTDWAGFWIMIGMFFLAQGISSGLAELGKWGGQAIGAGLRDMGK